MFATGALPTTGNAGPLQDLMQGIQSASAACMVAAQQGLDAAIEAVGTEVQSTTALMLETVGAGSLVPLVQDVFDAGVAEVGARVKMSSVRSLSVLRLIQLADTIGKAQAKEANKQEAQSAANQETTAIRFVWESTLLEASKSCVLQRRSQVACRGDCGNKDHF